MLFLMHKNLAAWTSVDEIKLDREEAKLIAEASAKVAEHYEIGALGVWGNLAMVAGQIYAPRILSFSIRKKFARQNSQGNQQQEYHQAA